MILLVDGCRHYLGSLPTFIIQGDAKFQLGVGETEMKVFHIQVHRPPKF